MGYLKKSGDIAVSGVDKAYSSAKLKTGIVGVQVRIMPSSTSMPDEVIFIDSVKLEDTSTGKVETLTAEDAEKTDKKKPVKAEKKTKEKSADAEKKPKRKPAKKKDADVKTEEKPEKTEKTEDKSEKQEKAEEKKE